MADIDQIIAGGAGAGTTADFSGIPKLLDSYWAGKDQAAKNDLREAFKGGVPTNPDGSLDISSVMKTLFQKGDIAGGTGLIGAVAGAQDRSDYIKSLGPAPQPPNYGPPATGRNAVVPDPSVRAPVSAAPAGTAQPSGQITPSSYLESQGIQPGYNREVGLSFFKRNGIEPDQPFDPNDPKFAKMIPVMQRLKTVGQVQPAQPGDGQPQAPQAQPQQPIQGNPPGFQPSPAQVAAQNDPELRRAKYFAASNDKAIAASSLATQKSIEESRQPTTSMKEYQKSREQGFKGTFEDWQNRQDENTTQREILKSLLPRIDKSQETATAARNDIDTLHRARSELDRPGGIFSGAFAGDKLSLAKAAELFGIPNADKVANTEAFSSAAGQRVASLIKAFGSGTAISDGDRRFTEAIAGGRITLDEKSIRRILDIGEKADRLLIERHNIFADKAVAANEGLKSARDTFIVDAPGQYKKPDTAALAAFSAARSAIDKGAPRDAVMKRLRENGHDPAGL